MWEAYGLENEDFLWAGAAFWGGIAGQQQGTCGALSTAAISLGLRHRCKLSDKDEAEKAHQAVASEAGELAKEFIGKFGAVTCIGLLGLEFSNEEVVKKAAESGFFKEKCHRYIPFIIEKLYHLEEKRDIKRQ